MFTLCSPARPFLTALFLLPVIAGRAAPLAAETGWVRLETENFTLLSNAGEAHTRALGTRVERLRDVLSRLAGAALDSPVPTRIYVFRDDASFTPYKLHRGGRPVEVVGYLVPHVHGNFAAINGDPETDPTRFVFKQYVLQLLHHHYPTLPSWFSQGVAEYFSTFEADDEGARIGRAIPSYVRWLRRNEISFDLFSQETPPAQGTTPSRKALVDLSSAQRGHSFYMQSWALVHYLLVGHEEYRRQTPAFLTAMGRGVAAATAWEQTFALDEATLAEQLRAYVDQEQFPFIEVEVRGPAEIPIESFPMAEYEVHYRLGDLLLHSAPSRREETAERFQKALAIDGGHGPSRTGLGYLAELAGDHDGARSHYEAAVELVPNDFLSQYLFGEGLLRLLDGKRPENDADLALLRRALDAFRLAVELRPAFGEAWARLGYAYGLEPRASAEGVEALETSVKLLPARTEIALNLVLAYARTGDREKAQAAADRLESLRPERRLLLQAREILLRLDFQKANQLTRQNQLDDAIAFYAYIRAETRDPALEQQAAEHLKTVAKAEIHNVFVESYNQVVLLLRAGDVAGAGPVLEELAAAARPGRQSEAVADLRQRLESLQAGRGE